MRIREIRKAESGKKTGSEVDFFLGKRAGRGDQLGWSTDATAGGLKMQAFHRASWPPQTFPRPSDPVAPRWIGLPLTRGDCRDCSPLPGFKAWIKKTNPLPGEEGGWLGKVRVTISGSGGGGREGRECRSRATRPRKARVLGSWNPGYP